MKRLKYTINVLGKRSLVQCGLTALLLLTFPRHVVAAEFIPLGVPDGYDAGGAIGISADGMVVTGYAFTPGDPARETIRWSRDSGITTLGQVPEGLRAFPRRVSSDGSVIAGNELSDDPTKPFRWTAETGMVQIVTPPHPVTGERDGDGIIGMSSDGSVLIGPWWRWDEVNGSDLLLTGGFNSPSHSAISADGSTIVGSAKRNTGGNSIPGRWTAGIGWEGLGLSAALYTGEARDVSADGEVVVGWYGIPTPPATREAFVWTRGEGIQTLGHLDGYEKSKSNFVSSDGLVVVGNSGTGSHSPTEYFRWTEETGVVPIGLFPGHDRNHVSSMSADGSVLIGTSYNSTTFEKDMFYWTVDDGLRTFTDVLVGHDLLDAVSGWEFRDWQVGGDFGANKGVSASADGLTVIGFGINPEGGYESWLVDLHDAPGVDFDGDGLVDAADVDALVGEIVGGTHDLAFDLNADGAVSDADLTAWLSDAATENGFAEPYLRGDSNLDGSVNAIDLNNLALKWQANAAIWTGGDFTADGVVDSGDLNVLALNWRQAIATVSTASASVPEPSGLLLTVVGLGLICRTSDQRRRLKHVPATLKEPTDDTLN